MTVDFCSKLSREIGLGILHCRVRSRVRTVVYSLRVNVVHVAFLRSYQEHASETKDAAVISTHGTHFEACSFEFTKSRFVCVVLRGPKGVVKS